MSGADGSIGPDPAGTMAAAKRIARERAVRARVRLSDGERRGGSDQAARNLLGLSELAGARTFLAYAALPAEIDPLPAVLELRRTGARIAYPRVDSPGVLVLHFVDDEREFVPGPFGLSEPGVRTPRAMPDAIDAVIVPGVAFDERGLRLGYGGGYYDRLLPLLRADCLRVGLSFDEQLLAELPAEEHDASVDMIVTPTRVVRPAKGPTSRRPARPE